MIELNMGELEETLRRAETVLSQEDYARLKLLAESYACLTELVRDKNTSIARLRKLLFGAKTEKTAAVVGQRSDLQVTQEATVSVSSSEDNSCGVMPPQSATNEEKAAKEPAKGHGRNGADAYSGAVKVIVRHPSLQPGDDCPHCVKGVVYAMKDPGVLVRLVGQAPIQATVATRSRCFSAGVSTPAKISRTYGTGGERLASANSNVRRAQPQSSR